MADDHGGGGVGEMEMLVFVFGGFAVLVAIWYLTGGPQRADLKGLFLSPPPPIGTGSSYGPQFGNPSNSNTNTR